MHLFRIQSDICLKMISVVVLKAALKHTPNTTTSDQSAHQTDTSVLNQHTDPAEANTTVCCFNAGPAP
jgi:hypothetical protein